MNISRSQRSSRWAWNLFKEPYRAEKHRERFVAVLGSLTSGARQSGDSVAIARRLDAALRVRIGRPISPEVRQFPMSPERCAAWLDDFFADEPEWEPRLRRWIDHMLAAD